MTHPINIITLLKIILVICSSDKEMDIKRCPTGFLNVKQYVSGICKRISPTSELKAKIPHIAGNERFFRKIFFFYSMS